MKLRFQKLDMEAIAAAIGIEGQISGMKSWGAHSQYRSYVVTRDSIHSATSKPWHASWHEQTGQRSAQILIGAFETRFEAIAACQVVEDKPFDHKGGRA